MSDLVYSQTCSVQLSQNCVAGAEGVNTFDRNAQNALMLNSSFFDVFDRNKQNTMQ